MVVGGGPTGIAAAEEALACGLPSLVIDDSPGDGPRVPEGVALAAGVSVLAISRDREILWSGHGTSGTFRAPWIVVAAGSNPEVVPFPGWTLPGVGFARTIGTLPLKAGQTAVVAGTSPGLPGLARRLQGLGLAVLAVVDAGEPVCEGGEIPVLGSHAVLSARGDDRLRSVTIGPVYPASWSPRPDRTRTLDVDWLVLDFGDVPRDELIPAAPPISFVGPGPPNRAEPSGVIGAFGSEDAGRVAGITAAREAGLITREAMEARLGPIVARLERLPGPVPLRPGLVDLATPGTVVCRCESVRFSTLERAVDDGACDMTAVKLATRLGMGACQGRECGRAAARMVAKLSWRRPEEVGRISPRPPARPVTLGSLARMRRDTLPPFVIGEAR